MRWLFKKVGGFLQFSTLNIYFISQDRAFVNFTKHRGSHSLAFHETFFSWPSTLISRSNGSVPFFDLIYAYILYILHPNVENCCWTLWTMYNFVLNISIFWNFWKLDSFKRYSGAIPKQFAVIPEKLSNGMLQNCKHT